MSSSKIRTDKFLRVERLKATCNNERTDLYKAGTDLAGFEYLILRKERC